MVVKHLKIPTRPIYLLRPSCFLLIISSAACCASLLTPHLHLAIKETLSFPLGVSPSICSSSFLPFIFLSSCSPSPSLLHCRLSSIAELVIDKWVYSCVALLSFNHNCFIRPKSLLDKVGQHLLSVKHSHPHTSKLIQAAVHNIFAACIIHVHKKACSVFQNYKVAVTCK